MQFNEEDSGNDYGTAENILHPRFSRTKIEDDSFCTINNPLREEAYAKSYSTFNIEFERNGPDQEKIKQGHLREITGWRRAITEDSPAIKHLQSLTGDEANILYRQRNIDELIEKSYFPVVQLDSKGELISFTAYDPFPNIPAVPSFFWNDWLNSTYKLEGACPRNVLFVHYMVWQPRHSKRFLRLLLETSFTEFLHLEHIIIVKPPNATVPEFYSEYFIPVLPFDLEIINFNSIQSLLVCLRTSIIRSLPIRTAFEEEMDVIMPFIASHINPKCVDSSCMVDFINFIYNDEKKTLICEFEGSVAGIMILNLKIDLDYLNEGFELAPFNGLRKKNHLEDEIYDRDTSVISKQSSTRFQDQQNPLFSSEFLFSKMNWELTLGKAKQHESSIHLTQSSESLFSTSDISGFSLPDLGSLLDVKVSEIHANQYPKLSMGSTYHGKNEIPNKGSVTMRMRTSVTAVPRFYFPKYRGPSNAFIIDFFAVDANAIDKKLSSYDFLEAAFKIIPDRDYCVLIIPTDLLPFPMLDMFVRVTPRIMSTLKQEVYLCHKNSLLVTSMAVRSIKEGDLVLVNNFLRNVNDYRHIYQDVLNSLAEANAKFQSYILVAEEKVVGVSVIDIQQSAEQFHVNFDLSKFQSPNLQENQSVIRHLILNPIYNKHARFFIRDIMRLADLPCLYYVYSESKKNEYKMLTMLGDLVPIKPKKKIGVDDCVLHQFREKIRRDLPYSLHLINSRLCGFSKFHLNIVIVVVGASRTAMSFLENLIFGTNCPYVLYNNLICVTPHALELDSTEEDVKDLMFPIRDNYNRKYLSMLSLETYVSFVYGIMTEINRAEKYIIVNNKATVKYDYLILTCGIQYLSPVPKVREVQKSSCKKFYNSSLAKYLNQSEPKKTPQPKHPMNMFVINTTSDAKYALHTLQRLMHKVKANFERKIIIYGHNLHVFLAINTLLKLGIPGEVIVFVEPFPSNSRKVTVFNDYQVDQAVLESIRNLKIVHYKEYFLYDWTLVADEYITAVTFQSKRKQVIIPCLAFFPFVQRLISDVTFKACTNAGLVYDGKLVINHNFKTNDDYIFAAGSFTKYARRYYAADQEHQFYNSAEVGKKLAHIIRGKIDPTAEDDSDDSSSVVPQMKAPLLLYCQLPGEFNFLNVRKPGKELDLETAYNFIDYGEVLTTGDCKAKKGYFRLHLDSQGFVESITCFTKDAIDYVSMYSLYGLHEKLLNNLLLRYDLGLITDLFVYFRQPWSQALFHENFRFLREYNYKAFEQKLTRNSDKTFAEKITWKLIQNQWHSLPQSVRRRIQNEYRNSKIEKDIKKNLLQFLKYYEKDLSVYAIPNLLDLGLLEPSKSSYT